MPHSLRAKLSGLRYKGILEDKDYKRLCKALDLEKHYKDVLEQIRADIAQKLDNPHEYIVKQDAYNEIKDIINSYIK